LRSEVGEMLLLLARTRARDDVAAAELLLSSAEACFPEGRVPPVLWRQRAALEADRGRAEELEERAKNAPRESAQDFYLEGAWLASQQRFRDALPLLRQATRRDPEHFAAWFTAAVCLTALGQDGDAIAAYSVAIALQPGFVWGHYNRGTVHL